MSTGQGSRPAVACPPTGDALAQQIHQRLDEIIAFCQDDPGPTSDAPGGPAVSVAFYLSDDVTAILVWVQPV